MPEEKVTRTTYGATCTCDKFGAVPCPLHSFAAADAGSRQLDPEGICDTLGFPHREGSGKGIGVTHFQRPSCINWQVVPDRSPVPQEAAFVKQAKYTREEVAAMNLPEKEAQTKLRECVSAATAPDSAMRVAEQIWDAETQWETVEDWITNCAALIRQAGSREPDGWAHRYHNCIRFNQGQEVNGEKPSEAVPYWLGMPGQAGSERELREYCLKRAAENAKRAAGDDDPRWFAGKADTYRRIASRLLGGE